MILKTYIFLIKLNVIKYKGGLNLNSVTKVIKGTMQIYTVLCISVHVHMFRL